MHQNAAGLAAQRDVAERFEGESVPRQPVGQRPDQHLARRAHRLQPLRGVHRVAGHRIGFAAAGAKAAGHDRPGVDADVKHQRRAAMGCRAFAQARRPRDHVESGAQRPLGIVFMRDRRPEQSEQRIADEFVDEAAKLLDRCRQLLEQFVLQGAHHFRVELLAQRGEAAEVGEQHGDGAAIGFGVGPGRIESAGRFDRRARRLLARRVARRKHDRRGLLPAGRVGQAVDLSATSRTKREIRRASETATGAKPRLLCSAFWAERKAALDFETATGAVHRSQAR